MAQELRTIPTRRYAHGAGLPDDLVILGRDNARLCETRDAIREKLMADRLRLHPHKAHIYQTARGVDLFGYRSMRTCGN